MDFEKSLKINNKQEINHYEGNYTLLLQERIHNPIIHQRLVDNFYEHLSTLKAPAFLQANNYKRTLSQAERARKKFVENLTREKIITDFEILAANVFKSTEIDYTPNGQPADSGGLGHSGTVYPLTVQSNGQPFSSKQMSMYEAHEKGHGIRMFYGESQFTRRLAEAFDFAAVSPETADSYRDFVKKERKGIPPKDAPDVLKYFESPHEIFERMSQLKNYFGMKGDEVFTKEHLNYARNHYIKDMGMLFQIAPFFEAITPETEEKFIELMNTLGI